MKPQTWSQQYSFSRQKFSPRFPWLCQFPDNCQIPLLGTFPGFPDKWSTCVLWDFTSSFYACKTQHPVATNPHTNSTNLDCESTCSLLWSSSAQHCCHFYSAKNMTIIHCPLPWKVEGCINLDIVVRVCTCSLCPRLSWWTQLPHGWISQHVIHSKTT